MTPPPSSPASSSTNPSGEERIVDVDLTDEMSDSFLEYAYSVIYQRALPDARDGLKPVQRRILYQMAEMGLVPEKGHVKSARVVGEVMGKLHPHGDSAIYDALVRLAQDFTLRVPMVDGHGNFGSLDDGPAAARYTEAKLRPEAMAMVADLDEDVVDFVPNYDNQLTQPDVLPAAIPYLLVNGASGIAVGMATNMAPHNLSEVITAARHLIAHPEATLKELMKFVPGPDLPGGGIIVGRDGIKDAYATGRGSFRTRARVSVEPVGPRSTGLVVTELPYLVGPERVIEKIKEGVLGKKIQGISDVNDLTDRKHGLRLVITVKSGFDPQLVLQQLYRLTPLEESFSINNVALVDGQPRTLGLTELLQVFVDHRIAVTERRSRFRLKKRQDRLHLVEGLLVAIVDIDDVIQVIRGSDDSASAKKQLCAVFDLSEVQADYILELRLRRLTKFSRFELETERDSLMEEIAQLTTLLADPQRIRELVSEELDDIAKQFDTPRRTEIRKADDQEPLTAKKAATVSTEREDVPTVAVLTATGLAGRFDRANRDQLSAPEKRVAHDAIRSVVNTTTRTPMGVVLSNGELVRIEAGDFPLIDPDKPVFKDGVSLTEFLGIDKKTSALGLFPLGDSAPTIALGTASGIVKRVNLATVPERPHVDIISLKDGDAVVGADAADESDWLCFMTEDAQLLRFTADQVRPQGPAAGGMAGIGLAEGARVIGFGTATTDSVAVVTVSSSSQSLKGVGTQRAKLTPLSDFPPKGRATKGVRAHSFLKGEDCLVAAGLAHEPRAVTSSGKAVDLPTEMAKRDASGTPLSTSLGAIGDSLDVVGR